MSRVLLPSIVALACGCLLRCAGGPPAEDKDQYHLFRPTPRDQMRAMSTDRPDLTESPYTVDAGHFQVETDLVAYAFDRWNEDRTRERRHSYAFGATNLKVGLLNDVDLQAIVEPYLYERTEDLDAGAIDEAEGFGDVTARLKINLWGNDGGPFAVGIMPFIKAPTNSGGVGNDAVEGGLIVPFAFELPAGFGLGVMAEFDFVEDADRRDHYHAEFIQTITIAREVYGPLGAYVEFFSNVSTEDGSEWVGSVDLGFTYAITEDIQLDAGVNVGISRAADDVNPFLGISFRFP